jgi:hypothetical protein
MNTQENNKLIAEFMGWDILSPTTIPPNLHLSNLEVDNGEIPNFKFHSSWDWLMPVVEKINNSFVEYEHNDKGIVNGLVKGKDGEWVDDKIKRVHNAVLQFNIKEIYNAVVEFIKWHNLNK